MASCHGPRSKNGEGVEGHAHSGGGLLLVQAVERFLWRHQHPDGKKAPPDAGTDSSP